MKSVAKEDKQRSTTRKQNGSGGDDTEENLIEVCSICHTKIHTGEIKISNRDRTK